MATAIVFDSGVGGLSVFDCIAASLPGLGLLYVADNAYFPYGTKEESALVTRVRDLLVRLAARHRPDLIVIACNTASTVALPAVRNALSLPIVGTVPAIKPAAQISVARVIGLLGTPGTVRRQYTQALIEEFAADWPSRNCAASRSRLPPSSELSPGSRTSPAETASTPSSWPVRISRCWSPS
jgi:glutamate racemase